MPIEIKRRPVPCCPVKGLVKMMYERSNVTAFLAVVTWTANARVNDCNATQTPVPCGYLNTSSKLMLPNKISHIEIVIQPFHLSFTDRRQLYVCIVVNVHCNQFYRIWSRFGNFRDRAYTSFELPHSMTSVRRREAADREGRLKMSTHHGRGCCPKDSDQTKHRELSDECCHSFEYEHDIDVWILQAPPERETQHECCRIV